MSGPNLHYGVPYFELRAVSEGFLRACRCEPGFHWNAVLLALLGCGRLCAQGLQTLTTDVGRCARCSGRGRPGSRVAGRLSMGLVGGVCVPLPTTCRVPRAEALWDVIGVDQTRYKPDAALCLALIMIRPC